MNDFLKPAGDLDDNKNVNNNKHLKKSPELFEDKKQTDSYGINVLRRYEEWEKQARDGYTNPEFLDEEEKGKSK